MEKIIKVKDKEYKLRLTSREVKHLETREGKGLFKIIGELDEGFVIDPIVKLMHAALQYHQPNMKFELVEDLYDDLVEYEGYDIESFSTLIEDILKSAGLFSGKNLK